MASLRPIIDWLDGHLDIGKIRDYPGALNGLQIENSGSVARIGAAVDACEPVFAQAAERGVTLLLVHHGLFWKGAQPVTGAWRRKLKLALDHDMAVYSAHLPLDMHPELGNNALLCAALGFTGTRPFFHEDGQHVGLQAHVALDRAALIEQVKKIVGGPVHLAPGGPERVERAGVVTGGAGSHVGKAAAEGVDTFITGEGPHDSYTRAEELGVNLIYAGHYATETFGVKALAAEASRRFGVPWEFIDHPTGL